MILQDLTVHDNPPHAKVVWLDEASGEVITHGYPNTMTHKLRAVLGAEASQYEALIAGLEATCPAPSLSSLQQSLTAALEVEYESRMRVISAAYPQSERESWPVQISEARALLADEEAATPWIDAAAVERGIDRLELAERIVGKDDAYRVIHGALTGARQCIEDLIDAAAQAGDAQALAAIDVTAGWP